MTLLEHIEDIRERLNNSDFQNEAAVSNGIVQRLLSGLGWPVWESKVVWPEYSVGGGRVDFALCHPESQPKALIEVKDVGKIDGAEEQLFQYAFHRGAPILVLTDGQIWRFFWPLAPGSYREREVRELDLVKDRPEKIAESLARYLQYAAVQNQTAEEAIKEDHRNALRQREAVKHMPEAWTNLIQEENALLMRAVGEETESLCGHKPSNEQIVHFLKNLGGSAPVDDNRKPSPTTIRESESRPSHDSSKKRQAPTKKSARNPATRLKVTLQDGTTIDHTNATDTFVDTIVALGIDRVKEINMYTHGHELITTSPLNGVPQRQHGRDYITMRTNTPGKKRDLDEIAQRLGISINVEIVQK